MARYRVIQPFTGFDPREKPAFTIPSGSVIKKEESFEELDLIEIERDSEIALVQRSPALALFKTDHSRMQ